MNKKYKKVTYSLPLELLKELENYSEETGLKKSNVIVKALEKYIKSSK